MKWFKLPQTNEMKVKHEAISKHLLNIIPGCKVRHKHESSADEVVFYMEISRVTKEFKVSDQYLQVHTIIELFDFIKQKEIVKAISTYGKVKVSIREGYPTISYK